MYEVPRVALINMVKEGKQIAAEIIQLQLMLANKYYTKDYVAEMYESLLQRVDTIQGQAEMAQQKVRELGPPSLGPLPDTAMRGLAELKVLAAELRAGKEPNKVRDEIVRINGTLVGPAMTQWFEQGVGKYNMINDTEASGRTLCSQVVHFMALGPQNEGVNAAGVDMPKLDRNSTLQSHPYLRSTPRKMPPIPNRYSPRLPTVPYQSTSPTVPYQSTSPTVPYPYQPTSPTVPYQPTSPTDPYPYQPTSPTDPYPYQPTSPTDPYPYQPTLPPANIAASSKSHLSEFPIGSIITTRVNDSTDDDFVYQPPSDDDFVYQPPSDDDFVYQPPRLTPDPETSAAADATLTAPTSTLPPSTSKAPLFEPRLPSASPSSTTE